MAEETMPTPAVAETSAASSETPAETPKTEKITAAVDNAGDTAEKPAAKAKKEKPPAVEDKPFADFVQQDYLPALNKAFQKEGMQAVTLKFVNQAIPVTGLEQSPPCWQIEGDLGESRRFNLYFVDGDIQGQRAFSCTASGSSKVTLESFLIDERKMTLDLMVLGVIKRLNGQKWLSRN